MSLEISLINKKIQNLFLIKTKKKTQKLAYVLEFDSDIMEIGNTVFSQFRLNFIT